MTRIGFYSNSHFVRKFVIKRGFVEKNNKKWMFRIIILLIILIGVAVSVCYKILPSILSHSLSKKMEVNVDIASITLGLDGINVNGLRVGNPQPAILPQALSVKTIDFDVPVKNFFTKNIVIPRITLEDVYLGLEFKSKRNNNGNWTVIMNNLSPSNQEGSDINVLIKELFLYNIRVDIAYKTDPKNIKTITFPNLRFYNVTSQGGIPSEQISRLVMRQVLKEIFSSENLQDMLRSVLEPTNGSNGLFRSLFNFNIQFSDERIK